MPGTRKRSILVAVALLSWSINSYADRLLDIDTYLAMKDVSQITLSPDGQFLAYHLSHYDLGKDASTGSVWMKPAAAGAPLRMTSLSSEAESPQWSPDNRYLAVLSNRENGKTQVWLFD
ncbi:MAG: hypothetical protein SH820_16765, partial [Xanthomonadales bacterium]|nr:hypothetical protein [Xanthomonadales bacterium]